MKKFLFVLCLVLLLTSDASAFGRRGAGLFGWRDHCGSTSQSQSTGSCGTCAAGQCASGNCATGCASGQCATPQDTTAVGKVTQTTFTKDGKQYIQYCDGTKCWIVPGPETAVKATEPVKVNGVTKIEDKHGNVWATDGNVWKVN